MIRNKFTFEDKKIIGMIHLKPLPGTPGYKGSIKEIRDAAIADMEALIEGKADAFIIENFGDIPYSMKMNDTAFAVMTTICEEISQRTTIPFGINVQYNNINYEWALAFATNADFIRAEVFVENRVGVHGVSYASAPELMRLKSQSGADIKIFADVNSKYSFALVDQPIDFTINSAFESGADAIIITGLETGKVPTIEEVRKIKKHNANLPIIIGSGISLENIRQFKDVCDAVIVGSSIKEDGDVFKPVDKNRVSKLSKLFRL